MVDLRQNGTPARAKVHCAIYTRKSSEEGLEQEFNSLDAQREACEAYVTSQKHEGWTVLATFYDDGAYSGGTMDRPALQQLLDDIRSDKVDVVVVYVDRLTRSLTDFAKIVEVLDAQGVVRVGHASVQHDEQYGSPHAQRAALLRPVRARGHGRANPRQDRRFQKEGHVDGRAARARLRRQAHLQQFDLLSSRAATTIRAVQAAWHYIFGFGGGSGGRGVADGRRERDTGRAQGQAGGGTRGGADDEAFAVAFDLGLGQGIQIGDDLGP